MPLPVVRSALGLPLGDRGLLPLPDALSAARAGVVAGGPHTLPILKGCLNTLPWGVQPDGGNMVVQFTRSLARLPLSVRLGLRPIAAL